MTARPIVLIGMRGAGKSSVAAPLARALGRRSVDLDALVVDAARADGLDAPAAGELLARIGEPAFREREARALVALLARDDAAGLVVAAGGGVVEREENAAALGEAAWVVWLDAEPSVLARRVAADATFRPPLTPGARDAADELAAVLERRRPAYARLADVRIDANSASIDELVVEIVSALDTRDE